jgi:hypothetical protein
LTRISDLDVYARLTKAAVELDLLADQCWSVVGETALRTSAELHRTLASAVYAASLRDTGSCVAQAGVSDGRCQTAQRSQNRTPDDRA